MFSGHYTNNWEWAECVCRQRWKEKVKTTNKHKNYNAFVEILTLHSLRNEPQTTKRGRHNAVAKRRRLSEGRAEVKRLTGTEWRALACTIGFHSQVSVRDARAVSLVTRTHDPETRNSHSRPEATDTNTVKLVHDPTAAHHYWSQGLVGLE